MTTVFFSYDVIISIMFKPKNHKGFSGLSCDVKEKTEEYLSSPNTLNIITLPLEQKQNRDVWSLAMVTALMVKN